MSAEGRRGAVVLRVDGELLFVPAGVATHVAPMPKVTRVAGAPPELLGIALHAGEVVPVIAVGPARGAMVVCAHLGEPLGIVGGEVVGVRWLQPTTSTGVVTLEDGATARILDVGALYSRLQAGGWAGQLSR